MCNLLFISQNAEQHLLTLMFGYGNQIVSYFWFNFTIINVLAWKYIVHNKYNVRFSSILNLLLPLFFRYYSTFFFFHSTYCTRMKRLFPTTSWHYSIVLVFSHSRACAHSDKNNLRFTSFALTLHLIF